MKTAKNQPLARAVKFSLIHKKASYTKEGSLRVWHLPQVPGEPFYVFVDDPEQAKQAINLIVVYDLFQFQHRIKPDYASASGLEIFEGGEWVEWSDESGDDILEIMRTETAPA